MADFFSNLSDNYPYLCIVLLTLVPALELRASIPYGILVADENWLVVAAVAIAANIVLGPVVFFVLDKFMHLLLRIPLVDKLWNRMILKTQRKIHPMVEKYGVLGLSAFIGVPLPGSGVYSGAIGGYLLGFTKREFYIATVIGVLIAATAVTAVVMTGAGTLDFFIKKV